MNYTDKLKSKIQEVVAYDSLMIMVHGSDYENSLQHSMMVVEMAFLKTWLEIVKTIVSK